ncbi:MAG: hypothetical protein ABEH47_08080 [Haloferacaceae archaeon]
MPSKRRTLLGLALMLVGVALSAPLVLPSLTGSLTYALVPGVLLLTAGTYLIGTDVTGHPV